MTQDTQRKLELLQQAHDRARAEVMRLAERLRKYEPGHSMHLNAAPADRDVMRQAPGGWKLVPIKPSAEMLDTGCAARHGLAQAIYEDMLSAAPTPPAEQPIDMVLHCPSCGKQHIDAPESELTAYADGHETVWRNPSHRSHLCHGCGHIWRPADVATNGVQAIKTKGKNDSASAEQQGEQEPNSVVDTTLKNLRRLLEHHKTFQARVADLRAKVVALLESGPEDEPEMVLRSDVLAIFNKAGGDV
ncbi:MAG TPA: hypothetical protein VN039_02615 [Nitrospira sp.]|nr:hypothetical protein [Nitrospira sp.]